MRFRRGMVLGPTLAALLLAAGTPAFAEQGRVVPPVDLGQLDGVPTTAAAINDLGAVVGYSTPPGPFAGNGILWSHGQRTRLPASGNIPTEINFAGQIAGNTSWIDSTGFVLKNGKLLPLGFTVTDQNAVGDVVGSRYVNGGSPHAQLWHAGQTIDLGTLGGSFSTATAVNLRGQVIGQASTADGVIHGAEWNRSGNATGHWSALPTLGGADANPTAINASGDIVGYSATPSGAYHAALWRAGRVIDLGTLGMAGSEAVAINDAGQIAAFAYPAGVNATTHAFRWWHGHATPLGSLGGSSDPVAINAVGTIAGESRTPDGTPYAVRWAGSSPTRLGLLVGGARCAARAINDLGRVVGQCAASDGTAHATLWN
ncbi:hypothetical protein [Pseudofrankia inefficax]|uniref:Extracellular repeat protein, HAF family n=1 Tax=Pseudofrankia inefficax (strain DSM 45817 / CECT 9037 / DDB 130130 / EuI1c) TaxID=298654 RepID=E3J0H5_PSEI1|nr:hypothetical protein [Pseudofrankia inefficax]ADP81604.1 hypothetical protein FraEuI1c_3597 [Pseudofrankia inefficax]